MVLNGPILFVVDCFVAEPPLWHSRYDQLWCLDDLLGLVPGDAWRLPISFAVRVFIKLFGVRLLNVFLNVFKSLFTVFEMILLDLFLHHFESFCHFALLLPSDHFDETEQKQGHCQNDQNREKSREEKEQRGVGGRLASVDEIHEPVGKGLFALLVKHLRVLH